MKHSIVLLLSMLVLFFINVTESSAQYRNSNSILPKLVSGTPTDTVKQKVSEKESRKNRKRRRKSEKAKANEVYDELGYKASIKMYKRLNPEEKKDVKTLAKIANGFRLNHETEDAEFWYARFITETNDPEHYLHYAQAVSYTHLTLPTILLV